MDMQLKTITALTLLISTGYVMADENTAEINQTGENNLAFIEQVSFAHTAAITQTGNGNEALIEQVAEEANIAAIVQTGNYNYAEAIGGDVSYYIDITQYGVGNEATALGGAYTSSVYILQGDPSTDSPSDYNFAYIDQFGCGDCSSRIVQLGMGGNAAFISAGGEDSYAHIMQDGADNYASILQSFFTGATVIQNGLENYANIEQSGYSSASIEQTGELHQADIQQGIGQINIAEIITQGGSNNRVDIVQDGDGHLADVRQYDVLDSQVFIEQFSEQQIAWVEQGDGIGNHATVSQGFNGSIANTATVVQYGSYNTATIVQ